MSDQPQHGDKIEAKIKIRRGEGWNVKPEGEAIDGARVKLQYAWHIEDGIYQGEVAWMPTFEAIRNGDWRSYWPSWIASRRPLFNNRRKGR